VDQEERDSGLGNLKERKKGKKLCDSEKLQVLSTLNDALHTMSITTGWAYLWCLMYLDNSTGEEHSSQCTQVMKMEDLSGWQLIDIQGKDTPRLHQLWGITYFKEKTVGE
jgi:hypothetical protein